METVKGYSKRIAISVLFLAMALELFGMGPSFLARTVSAVSYTPTIAYDFAGTATDSQNNSSLTFASACATSTNPCNVSTSYGTDAGGTYWQWTANRGRGGGFWIDTTTAVSSAYSMAFKISFEQTSCYRTIIDFSDGTDDDHLYFCGGMQFYPTATSTFQFQTNTIYHILISRQSDGKILAYVLNSSGVAEKILEVADKSLGGNPAHSLMIPAPSPSGGSRFRFFHDECCEYSSGGKIYDVRVWADQVLPPEQFGIFNSSPTTTTTSTTTTTTTTTTVPRTTTTTSTTIPRTTTSTTEAATTTSAPRVVEIEIQAPVTTIATGQASVATISPSGTTPFPTRSVATTTTSTIARPTTTSISPPVSTSPVVSKTPSVPKLSAGEGAVDVDGKTTKQTLVRTANQLVLQSGSLSATLSSQTAAGGISPLDNDGNLRLESGDIIKLSMGGFKPDSEIDVWFFSTPIKLGTAVVEADGTVSASYRVPNNIEDGAHRVAVVAQLADGKRATFTLGVIVGKLKTTSTLTRVLIVIPITLAVFFGFLLPTRFRRRRIVNA
jgi:hypothetical protein